MNRHYLLPHVHLSVVNNSGILLDLKKGDYIGLSPAQVRALGSVIQGWPSLPSGSDSPHPEQIGALVDTLMKRGLVTGIASLGKPAIPVSMHAARTQLVDRDSMESPRIRPGHALTLLWSCAYVKLSLRARPLGAIIRAVEARKARALGHDCTDLDTARDLVHVFLRLRPWFYSCRDQCLFDSLVLTTFLAHYRLFPTWVIGVKTDPFAAHSWVQLEGYVLNDRPGRIQSFAPIVAA